MQPRPRSGIGQAGCRALSSIFALDARSARRHYFEVRRLDRLGVAPDLVLVAEREVVVGDLLNSGSLADSSLMTSIHAFSNAASWSSVQRLICTPCFLTHLVHGAEVVDSLSA